MKIFGNRSLSPISQPDEKVQRRRRTLIRLFITLTPALFVALCAYFYFHFEAAAVAPPPGYVFPRESELTGVYRFEVLRGRRYLRSRVETTRIACWGISYYAGTWGQAGRYPICEIPELNEKPVQVIQVRVPHKLDGIDATVIKIVSNGKVYLNRTDAEVRELWIRDTNSDVLSKSFWIFFLLAFASWPASIYVINQLLRRIKA